MKKYTFSFCLLSCLIAAGCSGNRSLGGKVTFTDGEPVPNGMVIFQRDNFMSRGEIQSDGSYTLHSVTANDGIPPGEYSVYVTGVAEIPQGGGMSALIPLCDPKFENPSTSGLTCTIPAPGNRFDFKIERSK